MARSLAALAVLVVLCATAVLPASSAAAQHTVRGAGKDVQHQEFRLHAEGTPEKADGRVLLPFGNSEPHRGTVDCLLVDGRRAVLSGVLDTPISAINYFAIIVNDDPRDTRRPHDRLSVSVSILPIDCTTVDRSLPRTQRIVRGNIEVA